MSKLSLSILNQEGHVLSSATDENEVYLVYEENYQPGDTILLETDEINRHYIIALDDAMAPALVYLTEKTYLLKIPFQEQKVSYNPRSFDGNNHYITARIASSEEVSSYKNLAFNPYDCHENASCYPHAYANVETRGEAVFAARNAIDGVLANHSHGIYPYQSWGINQDPEACFTLEFGRSVRVDKITVYLRADFPHDNWWESMTVTFSDGSEQKLATAKTHQGQSFSFEPKEITWLKVSHLLKAEDPSPFPALTQIQVFGTEA